MLAHHTLPLVGHELVATVGRMHVVPDPVIGGRALDGFVENPLEMYQGGTVFLREFRDNFLPLEDVLADLSSWFHEWFAEDQLEFWVSGFCVGDQLLIDLFVLRERDSTAAVIDADENT